jgi:hypothetical protein
VSALNGTVARICSAPPSGQAPYAAWRRAKGTGLDRESADRAIINITPRCASSSDTVREIKYQILHLSSPRARPSGLLRRSMDAGTSRGLLSFPAAALRPDTPTQRIHEIDDFGRLALARRFDLLTGLLLLQQFL